APVREVEQILRAGARTLTAGTRRLHAAFVVSEIALAIILLVSAGMLGRALLHAASLDPGLDIRNLLVMRVGLSPATLTDPAKIPAGWQDLVSRARNVPGVQSATAVDIVPMRQGNNEYGYWTTADVPPENKQIRGMPCAVQSHRGRGSRALLGPGRRRSSSTARAVLLPFCASGATIFEPLVATHVHRRAHNRSSLDLSWTLAARIARSCGGPSALSGPHDGGACA